MLSGPNLAREVVQRQPTASVIACMRTGTWRRRVQEWTRTPYFRPYTNADVVGVELGGVVKNVIALATGMAEGMGFGDNSKAAIMTRGLAEMTRLGVAMEADPLTFMGLAGVGDLIATCSSPLSRNRTFGENLGRGMTHGRGCGDHSADRGRRHVLRRGPGTGPRSTMWTCRSPSTSPV